MTAAALKSPWLAGASRSASQIPPKANLAGLNKQQIEVITTTDRPCCVISIPGSGKTRIVTEKIIYLLYGHENGLWLYPQKVMAVTFTTEAAKELNERTQTRISKEASQRLQAGTFHSLLLYALRRIGSEVAYRKLASTGQAAQYLERSLASKFGKNWAFMGVTERQTFLTDVEAVRSLAEEEMELVDNVDDIKESLVEYKSRMKEAGLLDFAMILEESLLFLQTKGQAVERMPSYSNRFMTQHGHSPHWLDEIDLFLNADCVIVDEAQDIDPIQLAIILEISNCARIVDLVGDDDQSIYSFRFGLGYQGMKQFKEQTLAKAILLETNYRCRQEILQLADAVISQNKGRTQKQLVASRGQGGVVTLDEWEEGQKEASYICDSIKECLVRQKSKEKPQTMAIIARVNRVLDEMQGILTVREIAHERLGSKGIWGEPPVCFMVALLENMLNPMSTAGIDQCLYWAGVDTSNVNLDQLTFKTPPKGKRDAMVVEKLAKLLNACHKLAWSKSDEMVSKVVGMTYCWFLWGVDIGRSTKLQKASAQAVLRIATKTLGGSAATKLGEHVDDGVCGNESTADDPSMKRGLRGPLRKRLHSLSLLNRTGKNEANTVKLVSMHGSKGLEYDRVWLMSCDDGTIPGAIDDKPHKERLALLEEERRLMYVGITRARDSLHLSWSMYPLHRLGGTNQKEQSPCRILDALGRGDRPLSSARVSNDLKAGITV